MKNALLWGASGGIGRALTRHLTQAGWTVFAVSHHTTAPEVAALTPHTYEADVTDTHAVQAVVQAVAMEAGQVQLFIYAVGDITSRPVADMAYADWQRMLNANLTGPFLTVQAALPALAPDAHLVLLGAVSERLRLPGLSAYAAAKAGLEAFAEALRKELRGRKVTLVRPGAVDTPFWERVPFSKPKHIATPEKLAEKILEAYTAGHSGQLDLT